RLRLAVEHAIKAAMDQERDRNESEEARAPLTCGQVRSRPVARIERDCRCRLGGIRLATRPRKWDDIARHDERGKLLGRMQDRVPEVCYVVARGDQITAM